MQIVTVLRFVDATVDISGYPRLSGSVAKNSVKNVCGQVANDPAVNS